MPPNIYVYKCVVDDGTAPCIDRSLLSMTVCNRKVRAFSPSRRLCPRLRHQRPASPQPPLAHVAKITEIIIIRPATS